MQTIGATIRNFFLLSFILCVAIVVVYKTTMDYDIPIIKDIKVITKERITISGTVYKDKWHIVIDQTPDGYVLNPDLSYTPKYMRVDEIKTDRRFDYIAPIRVAYAVNTDSEFRPVVAYNPIQYKSLEIGIETDGKSAGIDIGVRYRNVGIMAFYQANNVAGVGIMIKVF